MVRARPPRRCRTTSPAVRGSRRGRRPRGAARPGPPVPAPARAGRSWRCWGRRAGRSRPRCGSSRRLCGEFSGAAAGDLARRVKWRRPARPGIGSSECDWTAAPSMDGRATVGAGCASRACHFGRKWLSAFNFWSTTWTPSTRYRQSRGTRRMRQVGPASTTVASMTLGGGVVDREVGQGHVGRAQHCDRRLRAVHDQSRAAAVDGDVVPVLDEQADPFVPVPWVGADGVGDVQLTDLGLFRVQVMLTRRNGSDRR